MNKKNLLIIALIILSMSVFASASSERPEILPGKNRIDSNEFITITYSNPEAKIFYTLDDSDPRNDLALKYFEPFKLHSNVKIRSIAVVDELYSDEVSHNYSLVVPTPRILPDSEKISFDSYITIECNEIDATIRYKVNDNESQIYTGPFLINDNSTISAIAVVGDAQSGTIQKNYEVLIPAPQFFPTERSIDSIQTVALTCQDPKASIVYSLNGETYTKYSGPFLLSQNSTIQAFAQKGSSSSKTVKKDYSLSVSPPEISFEDNVLTITASDDRAVIRYEIGGNDATPLSQKYNKTDDNQVSGSYYIYAKTYLGNIASEQTSYLKLQSPKILIEDFSLVKIYSEFPGVTINYSLDGSLPTIESAIYTEPIQYSKNMRIRAIASLNGVVSDVSSKICINIMTMKLSIALLIIVIIIVVFSCFKARKIKIKEKLIWEKELKKKFIEAEQNEIEQQRKLAEIKRKTDEDELKDLKLERDRLKAEKDVRQAKINEEKDKIILEKLTSENAERKVNKKDPDEIIPEEKKKAYYEALLNLPPGYTKAQIKTHFRDKIGECHTDKVNTLDKVFNELAHSKVRELNRAKEYLEEMVMN